MSSDALRSLVTATFVALCLTTPIAALAYQVPTENASAAAPHHFEIFVGYEIPGDAFPISLVFVGDPVSDLDHNDVGRAIKEAAEAWNQVPCSFAEFQWSGHRASLDDVDDEEFPIYFDAFPEDLEEVLAWTALPVSTPPQGMWTAINADSYQWSLDPHPFQRLDPPERPIVSLSAVLAHEFGHILGLAHTTEHNAATMAAHYLSDGSQTVLSADDKLGACHLYPRQGSECDLHTDCPGGAACVDGPHGAVCEIPMAEIGEYCAYDALHCRHFCQIENEETGTGYCSADCESDDDCAEHYPCRLGNDDEGASCLFDPQPRPSGGGCSTTGRSPLLFWVALVVILVAIRSLAHHSTDSNNSSKVSI